MLYYHHRIEGVTVEGKSSRDYKTTRDRQEIGKIFEKFSPESKTRVRVVRILSDYLMAWFVEHVPGQTEAYSGSV